MGRRVVNLQVVDKPHPCGWWYWQRCYFAVGERVTYDAKYQVNYLGKVVAHERNQYGRVGYVVELDKPKEIKPGKFQSVVSAMLEDLLPKEMNVAAEPGKEHVGHGLRNW